MGLALVLFLCAASGCGQSSPPTYPVVVNGHTLRVELARTDPDRQRGLQDRNDLPPNQGMLFIFDAERADIKFWMDRTYVPLSIAFMDGRGVITQMENMQPLTRDLHLARKPTRYALEVNEGWFLRNGVKVGDRVDLSKIP